MKLEKQLTKKGITYILRNGKPVRFKPWLGDLFSFLYDPIMEKSIFPKKLGGSIAKHRELMKLILRDVRGCRVLELAAGSGSASSFLNVDNRYTGSDISPGLLSIAVKKYRDAGFNDPEFFLWGAENLPFQNDSFDVCLCILALNFFPDLNGTIEELKRVLAPGGRFICCVPVPEKNSRQKTIRGTLLPASELEDRFTSKGFTFERINADNGSLLYFRASL